jgi:hypothetical protein
VRSQTASTALSALALFALALCGCADEAVVAGEGWPSNRPGHPGESSHVEGRVVSYPDGEPIAGMSVVVFDVQAHYEIFTTDEDGAYHAMGLPADFHRLKAWPLDGQDFIGAYYADMYFYCSGTLLDLRDDHHADGIDFRLPRGGTVTGIVTDGATGEPVENARIDVRGLDYYNSNIDPTVYTDADGLYTVVGLDSAIVSSDDPTPVPGNYELKVTVAGRPVIYYPDAYAADGAGMVTALRGEVVDGWDVVIPAGGSIEGTATDLEGTPLATGGVYARQEQQSWIQATASVGSDGTYTLSGLSPGSYTLEVASDGLATTVPDAVEVDEDGSVVGVDVALAPEGTVEGTVTGLGAPLYDVTVRAYPDGEGADANTDTDVDGRFVLGTLATGSYRVHVDPDDDRVLAGYLCGGGVCSSSNDADLYDVVQGEVLDLGAVALPTAAVIEGHAWERESGRPLDRIYITALPDDPELPSRLATSEEDGSFRLAPLVPGSYTLQAEPYRYCFDDPGWITWYSGGERRLVDAQVIHVAEGATFEVDIRLPRDVDGDEMADLWEWTHFLDTAADDSLDDPDLDGVANLDEYLEGTDPREDLLGGRGCSATPAQRAPIALVLLLAWSLLRRRGGADGWERER